ncbi:hypothetical protein OEA41_004389 [Lepraria neglecta]|uniref:Methyltransferase type 11 domain-containing protein n=1 Tax=Lepraria neglecta TaxID=209136 RepID=A0AAD9Z014_9LECA|nr:hypothetical protein OEA41_004389 [Lepraria neglecta]
MTSSIPPAAAKGFQNGSRYDQARPSYPSEAVDSLLKHLQVDGLKGARIVDLGAGTGIFTKLLANRDEGFEIYAVEPHANMRAELEKKRLKGVKVMEGGASSMRGVESQCVDAVVAAQLMIIVRFANMEALEEIYRVLIPGGVFGMIWNIEDYNAPKSWEPTTKWEAKLKEITWASGDDHPRFRHEKWRQVFEKQLESTPLTIQAADPLFSLPLGEESVKFTHWLSREAILDRYHSQSQFAVLEGEQLLDIKSQSDEAMAGAYVDKNERGELPLHGQTHFAWTTAIPGAPLKEGG